MGYHISTGLIKEKFASPCDCPLCEIKKVAEEQFLYEFLNDAVMEDSTRAKVNERGFCREHFDKLFARQNKLSLALQLSTRTDYLLKFLKSPKSVKEGLKLSDGIKGQGKTCIICDLVEESMVKYYKTVAELFLHERDFRPVLENCGGFCLNHYAELLKYAKYAGLSAKAYLEVLGRVEERALKDLKADLKIFCDKHDYRNAAMPLGSASTVLPRLSNFLYGKKTR